MNICELSSRPFFVKEEIALVGQIGGCIFVPWRVEYSVEEGGSRMGG